MGLRALETSEFIAKQQRTKIPTSAPPYSRAKKTPPEPNVTSNNDTSFSGIIKRGIPKPMDTIALMTNRVLSFIS